MYISKTTTILEDPFAPLDRREMRLVERCVAHARDRGLTRTARLVTRAGNGWIYPVAAAFLFLTPIEHAARCIFAAIISLAIAFTIYPPLKRALARTRPCDNGGFRGYEVSGLRNFGTSKPRDSVSDSIAIAFTPLKRALARTRPCDNGGFRGYEVSGLRNFGTSKPRNSVSAPLDRYSFPSGHAMTAAAFGTPIIVAASPFAIPIVIAACALVSWSRIALGHHYPSDIVAGTVLGAIIAATVAMVVM